MPKLRCPLCKQSFVPKIDTFPPFTLLPTGDDYEWIDGNAKLHFPHCAAMLTLRIRQALPGFTLDGGAYELLGEPQPVRGPSS